MKAMKVHPAADAFPMLGDDELKELADDIVTNGLIYPIIIDDDGVLIDGRNRLKACEIAGVEPRFEKLNGHDPIAFIYSTNITRRNLSQGQKAVATAVLYPDLDKGGRGKNRKFNLPFSKMTLSQARYVCANAPALVDEVKSGAMTLTDAYAAAKAVETEAAKPKDALSALRVRYADLADAVVDGEMTMPRALQQANERDELAASKRRAWSDTISRMISTSAAIAHPATVEEIRAAIADGGEVRAELATFFKGQRSLEETLQQAVASMLLIAGDLQRKGKS